MVELEKQNSLGVVKVDIWRIIRSVKQEVLLALHVKKRTTFSSECRSKNKINSVDENKPEGIYYIDLGAFESDSECENNITVKNEGKKLSKIPLKQIF